MTRTIARRLATVGGALGLTVLICVGTATADSAAVSADGGTQAVAAHAFAPHLIVLDEWDRAAHRNGVAGDLALDLGKVLRILV
jgi:hypothetical protein